MLGVMGFLTSGPLQYAGTAYSVGEYTYQYAVNDKTPDEVFTEKLSWLMPSENDPTMAGYAKALKSAVLTDPHHVPDSRIQLADNTEPHLGHTSVATLPYVIPETARPRRADPSSIEDKERPTAMALRLNRPSEQKKNKTGKQLASSVQADTPRSIRPEIEPKSDPLYEKMERLDEEYRQNKRLVSVNPDWNVRGSVSTGPLGQPGAGISGSWSIRHRLMQSPPPRLRSSL